MKKKRKSIAESIRPFISVAVLMLLLTVPTLAGETSAEPASNAVQRVLVISSFDRLLPAGIAAEQALRKSVLEGYEKPVEFFTEFLDESRFKIDKLNIVQRDYFRGKYAAQQPSLIYCAGNLALKFLAQHKSTLFPEVPIVYIYVTESEVSQVQPDARVVGLPISHQCGSTLDLALRLLPDTQEGHGDWRHIGIRRGFHWPGPGAISRF